MVRTKYYREERVDGHPLFDEKLNVRFIYQICQRIDDWRFHSRGQDVRNEHRLVGGDKDKSQQAPGARHQTNSQSP